MKEQHEKNRIKECQTIKEERGKDRKELMTPNSMEQRPSREANRSSDTQEIPRIL
jgi:hypothetical protein